MYARSVEWLLHIFGGSNTIYSWRCSKLELLVWSSLNYNYYSRFMYDLIGINYLLNRYLRLARCKYYLFNIEYIYVCTVWHISKLKFLHYSFVKFSLHIIYFICICLYNSKLSNKNVFYFTATVYFDRLNYHYINIMLRWAI